MTSASPSEFLTFMRHVTVRSSIRPQTIHPRPMITAAWRLPAARSLHITQTLRASQTSGVKTDQYPDSKHATSKKDQLDVQSHNAAKGKSARAAGGEDNATSQSDDKGSTEKAKKDHPEAPDVVIGMQDERGQKGL